MAYADPRALADRIFAEAFAPDAADLTVDAWCDAHRIVAWGGPKPGPWCTDDSPHLREPMRDFTDPSVRSIALQFSPQVLGKTEYNICVMMYAIAREPNDAIMFFDRDDTATAFADNRLIPNLRECPETRDRLGPSPRDTTITRIRMDRMTLWLRGSGSASQLANITARYVVQDELDKWAAELRGRGRTEGSAETLADARADAWGTLAKIVKTSSPSDEGVGINAAYQISDQAERWYPCPLCGWWQPLMLGDGRGNGPGVVFTGPGGSDLHGGVLKRISNDALAECATHVRTTATYRCASCKGLIENHHRPAMIRAGAYVRAGQRVEGRGPLRGDVRASRERGGMVDGGARIMGVARRTDKRGYTAGWLDAMGKRFGDVAAEFVGDRGIINRGFVNRVLSQPWRQPGSGTSTAQLRQIVRQQEQRVVMADGATDAASDRPVKHTRGSVPRGTLLVVGIGDVQIDRVVWQIVGYGPGQRWDLCQRALIEYGETPFPMVDDAPSKELEDQMKAGSIELDDAVDAHEREVRDRVDGSFESRSREVLDLLVRKLDGWGGVDFWGLDSGDRSDEVYGVCGLAQSAAGLPAVGAIGGAIGGAGRFVTPMKGRGDVYGTPAPPLSWTPAVMEMPADKLRRAALLRYRMGLQVLLFSNTYWKDHTFPAMHDAERWVWPADVEDHYLAQLTSEHKVEIKASGITRGVTRWVPRPGAIGKLNHWWDCTVMERALICAALRGGGMMTAEHAPRRPENVRVGKPGPATPRMRVV